ncbi:MAG: trehalose-phosphatase [Gammaproteobacteria bacterium]
MRRTRLLAPSGHMAPGLNTVRVESFFAGVRDGESRVLMLDYDGTLAPFRARPQNALPYPGVVELIDEIMRRTDTQVAIVSGRWIRDLVGLLRLRKPPEIWGTHGREHLAADGTYRIEPLSQAAQSGLLRIDVWEHDIRALGGRVERKPASMAVHWRGLSDTRAGNIRALVRERWDAMTEHTELVIRDFNGGIEILARGFDKSVAVDSMLARAGPGCVAAYLGDDHTDDDAMRAIRTRGIGVLVGRSFRPSPAEAWVRPPHGVRGFLQRWLSACRAG